MEHAPSVFLTAVPGFTEGRFISFCEKTGSHLVLRSERGRLMRADKIINPRTKIDVHYVE